jgi:hypothetical protein
MATRGRSAKPPRSRTRRYRFGPGYLEGVALSLWTKPRRLDD